MTPAVTAMMTAATTDDRRSTTRGAAARLYALAALGLILCLIPAHAARAQDAGKDETIDSVRTGAGALSLVRSGEPVDLRMELRLDGKKVADVESMYAGFKAHFREMETGDVVVMWASEGGSACPAQFRLIRVVGAGKVSVTEEFGDCSDSPAITLESLPEEQVLLRFPGYYRLSEQQEPGFRKPPPTTWVYKKGVLRELKPAAKRRG